MEKVLSALLRLVALPFLLVLLLAHYLGLLFAISMIVASIAAWGFGAPMAAAYFSVAWKIYAGIGVFTFVFLATFEYQNCCVGLQSFGNHVKHHGWRGAAYDLLCSLIWPWCWFGLDRSLKGWGMSFADALCNAIEYWLVSSWRGVTVTHVDVRSGETTTTRVKTPEDAHNAIRDVLDKPT